MSDGFSRSFDSYGNPPYWLHDTPGGPQDVSHTAPTEEEVRQLFSAIPGLDADFSDSKTPPELKRRVRIAEVLVKAAVLAEGTTRTTSEEVESALNALHWQQLCVIAARFRRQTNLVD